MAELLLAATFTAIATGLGVIPVIALGTRASSLQPLLLGLAGGTMAVAAVQGLLIPALDRGSALDVGIGFALGVAFLAGARSLLSGDSRSGEARYRVSLLVFLVFFVHSLPEGFAIGTAYATDPAGLGLFIVLAIAIQNIPEGTSVAVPMAAEGASAPRMFGAAVLTSALQPLGAAIAYLLVETIEALLPISFGFAAGAMLVLVVVEVMPQAIKEDARMAWLGGGAGAVVMAALSSALAV